MQVKVYKNNSECSIELYEEKLFGNEPIEIYDLLSGDKSLIISDGTRYDFCLKENENQDFDLYINGKLVGLDNEISCFNIEQSINWYVVVDLSDIMELKEN